MSALLPADQLRNLPEIQREQQVTAYLENARDRLNLAVEMTGPEAVAQIKAEISTAAEATKQLNLSKEIQQDALEMVRRAEYALGKAIRKGQADGTVLNQYEKRAQFNRWNGQCSQTASSTKHSPSDFASNAELRGNGGSSVGIYDLADGVPEEEFEEALGEARSEDNLSRANVARKLGDRSPKPTGEKRLGRIRELAEMGYSSRQMAPEIGVQDGHIRGLARSAGIDIPADRVVGKTRRIDANRVVTKTAAALEGLVIGLENTDLTAVDPDTAREWIDSLNRSLKALSKARNQIKESIND